VPHAEIGDERIAQVELLQLRQRLEHLQPVVADSCPAQVETVHAAYAQHQRQRPVIGARAVERQLPDVHALQGIQGRLEVVALAEVNPADRDTAAGVHGEFHAAAETLDLLDRSKCLVRLSPVVGVCGSSTRYE